MRSTFSTLLYTIGGIFAAAWVTVGASYGLSALLQMQRIGRIYTSAHPYDLLPLAGYWPSRGSVHLNDWTIVPIVNFLPDSLAAIVCVAITAGIFGLAARLRSEP